MFGFIKKLSFLTVVMCLSIQLYVPLAHAASGPVTSQGLFTSIDQTADADCNVADAETLSKGYEKAFGKQDLLGFKDPNSGGKLAGLIGEPLDDANNLLINNLFPKDCKKGFSFTDSILKLTSPVNVTNNRAVMMVTNITQLIAFSLSIIFVIAFAIMYTMGNHKLSPVKFAFRLFFSLISVYFAPYLIQDILNLCNVIVYHLSAIDLHATFNGSDAILKAGAGLTLVFAQALAAVLSTIILGTVASGGILLLVYGAIIMILFALLVKPLLRLIMWWYLRLLSIFFLTCIAPLFLIMLILPQTSSYAMKWLNNLIGEVFSQVLVVILIFMYGQIFANISDFMSATGINFLGVVIMMYAMINILADAPNVAQKLLGGGLNAGADAVKGMSEGIGNVMAGAISAGTKRVMEKKGYGKDPNAKQHAKESQESQMNTVKGIGAGGARDIDASQLAALGIQDSDKTAAKEGIAKGMERAEAGASRGHATEERAKNAIANNLIKQGFNETKAGEIADGVMLLEQERTGLSWNGINELGGAAAKDSLTSERAEEIVRNDILNRGDDEGNQMKAQIEAGKQLGISKDVSENARHASNVLEGKVKDVMKNNGLDTLKSEKARDSRDKSSKGPSIKIGKDQIFDGSARVGSKQAEKEKERTKMSAGVDKFTDLDTKNSVPKPPVDPPKPPAD